MLLTIVRRLQSLTFRPVLQLTPSNYHSNFHVYIHRGRSGWVSFPPPSLRIRGGVYGRQNTPSPHPNPFWTPKLWEARGALASGVWLAAGAPRQCQGSASLQRDRAGNGTEREEEVGTFSLGPSEVLAAELSRVGGTFHCSLAMGAKLLSTTAGARQGAPRGGARVGLQTDSHCFPLLERSGDL